ncbi:hypothetical protein KK083_04045 [Fulvivirgaceae bacterium PWU4]|uniref:Uncharacterized protein n=1 Tax=Chryseosolibacter histidini TaxID=2782349 RepID=A0AAP2DGS8_9BACT|nr:hypothetical protein [Chryseosolibacter histidini]MBT1696035.1 hypothetical protein [Chryseosolibacter histidini]
MKITPKATPNALFFDKIKIVVARSRAMAGMLNRVPVNDFQLFVNISLNGV